MSTYPLTNWTGNANELALQTFVEWLMPAFGTIPPRHIFKSPNFGTFVRSLDHAACPGFWEVGILHSLTINPDAKPLVEVGDKISRGMVIGGIYSMGEIRALESDVEGTICEIMARDGQGIVMDCPLFRIEVA